MYTYMYIYEQCDIQIYIHASTCVDIYAHTIEICRKLDESNTQILLCDISFGDYFPNKIISHIKI